MGLQNGIRYDAISNGSVTTLWSLSASSTVHWDIATFTIGTTSYYSVNTGHSYIRAVSFIYNSDLNYAQTQDKRNLFLCYQDGTIMIFQLGTIPSSGTRSIKVSYGYVEP